MTPKTNKPILPFRQRLERAMLLKGPELELFNQIPDAILEGIFRHNFNGNLATADRVLFNRYSEVDKTDHARLENEKQGIRNLLKASRVISKSLVANRPVLFVTDNDNDGSLAQAILIEFLKTLPQHARELIHIEYAQPIGSSRGLTYEVVEKAVDARQWGDDTPFTLVTADNGINNRVEQERIQARWTEAQLIITDHHLPNKDVVLENDRTLIFNPKNQPTEYFQNKNISGANTLGVLLTKTLDLYLRTVAEAEGRPSDGSLESLLLSTQKQAVSNMAEIGSWANLLDYANSDIADMPTRPYIIEKALNLRPLLNVSNSMNTLVTGLLDDRVVQAVVEASEGKLDLEWVHEQIEQVRLLNRLAHKLLNLHTRNQGASHAFNERDFYIMLADEVGRTDDVYTSINPNYIEQLRPIIFNLAAIDDKDLFQAQTAETMTEVFQSLRQTERNILDGLRQGRLLNEERQPNSSILYPTNPLITKVFNRKLLGKAYNQDNNGFLLILSRLDPQEASGSMRALYPISQILEGKADLEQRLGVELEFQGHEMAAGFFIRAREGHTITPDTLTAVNTWISERIGVIKDEERVNQLPTLEVDFAAVGLIKKVNAAVKANLAGMWGLPTVVRFSGSKDEAVWVTDPATTEQVNLTEIVKRKRYGYQAIATDFHGGAFVVPIELLRAVVDSGYTKALRLSYMDEGVFMAHQVVDADQMPRLVSIKGSRDEQDSLMRYYNEAYKDSHFIPLSRDDFRTSPYFRFNRFGEREFEQWESLIITMLDESKQDVLAVIDTEGTGLGKAPKCFNIGGTNIKIAADSGTTLEREEFEQRYYRDASGKEYLLSDVQISHLMDVDEDEENEEFDPKKTTLLYKTSLEYGVDNVRVLFPGSASDLERVSNVKEQSDETGKTVVYNRRIDGFAFAFLINNNDFAITKEFEDLTGISNGMVERLGVKANMVDDALTKFYGGLTNPDGTSARIIFQAHNMPYDKGVISANFQKFNELIGKHTTSDTAKMARKYKLAYDDTPVCSFLDVEGIPAKTYFYDSPYSNYSMTTFLDRVRRGKGGVYPDITAKYLLRYTPATERFSLIDRVENREIQLDVSVDQLATPVDQTDADGKPSAKTGSKVKGQLPNNAVKYSVERMSSRAMIRNILLHEALPVRKVRLTEEEYPFRALLERFQENYHFDSTIEKNIDNFKTSLVNNERSLELLSEVKLDQLAARFLELNREIQAKFHDSWIYEKVLAHYEPSAKNLRVPNDAVEQINYLTDLPSSKIRKVCEDVIKFKRHFNIHHAMVHEQHNNIRQRSADGQGLSDTAYECVLPQLLGMMKTYNPYYQSARSCARQMIDTNVQGSMIQTMVGDEFNAELARDSFSVKQMLAFSRTHQTDLIKRAKASSQAPKGKNAGLAPIKFKLSPDVLTPNTAVYGVPQRHLSQEEVEQASEQLDFILVNEQIKEAALTAKIPGGTREQLIAIAQANDERAIAMRDVLLTQFERLDFSRKDANIKKISDLMKEAAEDGAEPKLPRGFKVDDTMLEAARTIADGMNIIFDKIGKQASMAPIRNFVEGIEEAASVQAARAAKGDRTAAEAQREMNHEEAQEYMGLKADKDAVRQANFLPDLPIERKEPLRFMLKFGVDGLLQYIKKTEAEAAANAEAVQELADQAAQRRRSRGP